MKKEPETLCVVVGIFRDYMIKLIRTDNLYEREAI